jgi:hypothetical protein
MSNRVRRLVATAALLALSTVALLVPLPGRPGGWEGKLYDLGHVPLFVALTLGLRLTLGHTWLAAFVAVTVAGLGELLQGWFGRSGTLSDFVTGALSVAAAVVLLNLARGPRTAPRVAGHAALALALVAWPVLHAAPRLLDAWEGYQSFPTLADFSTGRQMARWHCHQAELTRLPDPDGSGEWLAKLELLPGGARYPGATLIPVPADWGGCSKVCCLFAVEGEPLRLTFSLRAASAATEKSCHFQTEALYHPGEHLFRMDLAEAARLARPAALRLDEIHTFQLFTYRLDRPRVVRLYRVWLE